MAVDAARVAAVWGAEGLKRFLIIGDAGVGKSTLLNNSFGQAAETGGVGAAGGVTKVVQAYDVGHGVHVIDTPGLGDRTVKLSDLVNKLNQELAGKAIHAILFCVDLMNPRFSLGQQVLSELFPTLFPVDSDPWRRVVLVGTKVDTVRLLAQSMPQQFGEVERKHVERAPQSLADELSKQAKSSGFQVCAVGQGDYGTLQESLVAIGTAVNGANMQHIQKEKVVDAISKTTGVPKTVIKDTKK